MKKWSACRISSYLRNRESGPMVGSWEPFPPPASGPSSRRSSKPLVSPCLLRCSNIQSISSSSRFNMSPVILFGLLLLLTFGVIVWVLKPSKSEADVQRHLRSIGGLYTVDVDGTTILKREALSSIPWLNDVLQRVPGSLKLRLFIMQAGSRWAVSSVLLGSLLLALVVAWLCSFFIDSLPIEFITGLAMGSLP